MGIHSAFAGLALGLYKKEVEFFSFLLAIVLHKWAEALTVGISMVKEKMSMAMTFFLLMVFCIATPLGIVVGIIFSNSNPLFSSIMSSVSAGTFLYISNVEIFAEEFSGPGDKRIKFIASFGGVVLMSFVAYLEIM